MSARLAHSVTCLSPNSPQVMKGDHPMTVFDSPYVKRLEQANPQTQKVG